MKPTEVIIVMPTPRDEVEYESGYLSGVADAEYGDFPATEGYAEEYNPDWRDGYEDGYYETYEKMEKSK